MESTALGLSPDNTTMANVTNTAMASHDADRLALVDKVFYTGLLPCLIFCGLIMNGLSLILLKPRGEMTSTTFYLLNLTVADIFVLLNGVVNSIFKLMEVYGHPMAALWKRRALSFFHTFFNALPGRLGNLLTAAICIERFVAVLMTMRIRRYPMKKIAIIVVVFLFLYDVFLSLPFSFVFEVKTISMNVSGKTVSQDILTPTKFAQSIDLDLMFITTETCLRFIPVALVTIFSFLTLVVLFWKKQELKQFEMQPSLFKKRELKVTKTILALTITFIVCQLPETVLRLLIFVENGSDFYRLDNFYYSIVTKATYFLFNLNSCVNFLIYVGTSEKYRQKFRDLIRFRANSDSKFEEETSKF